MLHVARCTWSFLISRKNATECRVPTRLFKRNEIQTQKSYDDRLHSLISYAKFYDNDTQPKITMMADWLKLILVHIYLRCEKMATDKSSSSFLLAYAHAISLAARVWNCCGYNPWHGSA